MKFHFYFFTPSECTAARLAFDTTFHPGTIAPSLPLTPFSPKSKLEIGYAEVAVIDFPLLQRIPYAFDTFNATFESLADSAATSIRSQLYHSLRPYFPPPRITPPPVGPLFGPLTLADTPPTPALCLEAPTPSPFTLITRVQTCVQTCRFSSGRRRRLPSSTWTAPRFKPPHATFLLHRGMWNHAPWLDPMIPPFSPSSCAGQAFLWLCPPRPKEPP